MDTMEDIKNKDSFVENGSKLLSQIFSFLLHPMFMPVLGVFLIFNSGTHLSFMPFEAKRAIYITVFLTTCILPVSLLPLLYQFKVIRSFNMQTSRERLWPIIFTATFNYLGWWLLKKMGLSGTLQLFILSTFMVLIIAAFITLFWKVSLHMIGVGGATGVVLAMALKYNLDLTLFFVLLIIASAITASSRLRLGAHTPTQVYVGYFLGLGIISSSLLFA